MRVQRGFTLLELMVAMAIFATLAVAGWQVFDSVNRARERAQLQADNLAVMQYAYLQLQQDMGQIVAYRAADSQNANEVGNNNSVNNDVNSSNTNDANSPVPAPEPFMRLDSQSLSFVRFADPDPRYQSSPSLQRIEYVFADRSLIRRQYTSINGGSDSVSLDSVLLEGITDPRWQALLPEVASRFPDKDNSDTSAVNQSTATNANNATTVSLVPKGITVSFTYQEIPITWQWSLAPQPLPLVNNSASNNATNDTSGNNNNGSSNESANGSENNSSNNNSSGSIFNGL